jgi:phosphatidylinositol alpha-mannosyltransferase
LSAPLKGFASAIDHRVAVSKDAVHLAQRYIGGDYQILPNGVELDRFLTYSQTPRATHDEASPTRQAIFFCGRHEPRKGLEILLQAHATLPDTVDLWIASEGPETERLKREWAGDSRIVWLGRISDAEKAMRLSQADVFCAPSLGGESFGVVLIEAMAAATPIVASALDGYMNVATNEVDALLVEPNNPTALEAALRRILLDQNLADQLVAQGQERAKGFSMVQLAQTYVEIYRRIIAESQNRPNRSQRVRRFFSR